MEEVGYYAAIAVLIAFGLLAGNRWARSMGHAVLLGLAGTTIAVVTFLCLGSPSFLPMASSLGKSASGWARCCSSDRRSGSFRRSAAGGAPRKHRLGCFNGRNARLPESRPAT
jgi:hypothetical protein